MARDFDLDTGEYLSFGVGGIGALLNGAAKISFSAIVRRTTAFSTAGVNDNRVVSVIINSTNTTGIAIAVDANTSSGNGKLRIGGRSVSTDGFQAVNGATTLSADGTVTYQVGGVLDISGDAIRVYLDGVEDGNGAATFGNAAYTHGTPVTNPDTVGSLASTALCWDGDIAELAFWISDIGAAGFAKLGKRLDPRLVDFDNLVLYCPIDGKSDPEPELISRLTVTNVGSVPYSPHPAVIRRGSTRVADAAVAAASARRHGDWITVPFVNQGHWTGARV